MTAPATPHAGKLDVLHLTPGYHPATGGAETHVRLLAEGLADAGHDVRVLTDALDPEVPVREQLGGVEVLRTRRYRDRIDGPGRVPWEECLFGPVGEFAGLVGRRRPDLIHAHCQASALLGAMMRPRFGCPLVLTNLTTRPESEPMGEARSDFVFGALPLDLVIAGSRHFRDQALRHGAPEDRVRLVHFGIDVETFAPGLDGREIRRSLRIGPDAPLVLLVGRFKERKGILEFVRALERTADRVPDIRALINGSIHSASASYAERVRSEIRERGLEDRVHITGGDWSAEEMPRLYAAADLVVQPSRREGFGLALLEAMASGKAVIGTDVSGIDEILVHGDNGRVVPPGDETAMADAMAALLESPETARRLGRRARAFVVRELSADRMVRETTAAYADVLEEAA